MVYRPLHATHAHSQPNVIRGRRFRYLPDHQVDTVHLKLSVGNVVYIYMVLSGMAISVDVINSVNCASLQNKVHLYIMYQQLLFKKKAIQYHLLSARKASPPYFC